jgi:hypothetical protein
MARGFNGSCTPNNDISGMIFFLHYHRQVVIGPLFGDYCGVKKKRMAKY